MAIMASFYYSSVSIYCIRFACYCYRACCFLYDYIAISWVLFDSYFSSYRTFFRSSSSRFSFNADYLRNYAVAYDSSC